MKRKLEKNRSPKSRSTSELKITLTAYGANEDERSEILPILKMFYEGAIRSSVAISKAKDKDGVERILLVGVDKQDHGSDVLYPIALVLDESAMSEYTFAEGIRVGS